MTEGEAVLGEGPDGHIVDANPAGIGGTPFLQVSHA
jgi:hypothetical protein